MCFLISALLLVVAVSWILARFVIKYIFKYLLSKASKEILVLASITLAFLMLLVSFYKPMVFDASQRP